MSTTGTVGFASVDVQWTSFPTNVAAGTYVVDPVDGGWSRNGTSLKTPSLSDTTVSPLARVAFPPCTRKSTSPSAMWAVLTQSVLWQETSDG